MDRRLKIFLACGFGAGIGTIVALSVNTYFWWLGMLVGGLAGYFSYEFRKVLAAIRQAWHLVIGWRPDKDLLKLQFKAAFWTSSSIVTCLIGLMLLPLALIPELEIEGCLLFIGGGSVIFLITLPILFIFTPRTQKELERDIWIGKIYNPFSVYCYYPLLLIWRTPKGIRWLIRKSPLMILTAWRFIKTVFVLIHSDLRLLCGFDAAIGTAIGYFTSNVIIGMLAGGVIGVLNYELLSKRLLHLVPSKNH